MVTRYTSNSRAAAGGQLVWSQAKALLPQLYKVEFNKLQGLSSSRSLKQNVSEGEEKARASLNMPPFLHGLKTDVNIDAQEPRLSKASSSAYL